MGATLFRFKNSVSGDAVLLNMAFGQTILSFLSQGRCPLAMLQMAVGQEFCSPRAIFIVSWGNVPGSNTHPRARLANGHIQTTFAPNVPFVEFERPIQCCQIGFDTTHASLVVEERQPICKLRGALSPRMRATRRICDWLARRRRSRPFNPILNSWGLSADSRDFSDHLAASANNSLEFCTNSGERGH